MFHHAAYGGNDSFTEYLVKKANEAGDKKKEIGELLHHADATDSNAIQFAAKNRKKGVVAILLGANKSNDSDDTTRSVTDEVNLVVDIK